MLRKLAYVLALVPGLWMTTALGLGLGEIEVRSKLNQRFSATIPVVSANPDDIDGLTVRLAGSDEFARVGIERADYLSTMEFVLVPSPEGALVRITSKQVARDPFLNFIVEGRWSGGRALREYTVLLDPPSAGDVDLPAPAVVTKPVQAAPAVVPPPAPAPIPKPAKVPASAPAPKPAAPALKPVKSAPVETSAASDVPGSYGPVSESETLWGITTKLRPEGVTFDQMLLALYEGNPKAFDGGINNLLKGGRLTVPSVEQIKAVDAETAKLKVDELRKPGVVSASAVAAPVAEPAPVPAPAVPPKVEPKAEPAKIESAKPEPTVAEKPAVEVPAPAIEATPSTPPDAAMTGEATPAVPGTEAETAAPAAVEPPPVVETPAAPAVAEEDFLTQYKLPLIGVLAVLALGILAFTIRNRRKGEEPRRSPSTSPVLVRSADAVGGLPGAMRSDDDTRSGTRDDDSADAETSAETAELPSSDAAPIDGEYATPGAPQAVGVNLDANDPMTEATFHLSYGLYDEAAQMLKQAAAKDPDRLELRTKLAETYFAAGKPMEFQETAESLQGRLSAAEWQKIAGLGRKLCPDVAMFKSADDEGLDAPAARGPLGMSVIDFDLDTEMAELPPMQSPVVTAPPKPAGDGISSLDLSQFDLGPESAATVEDPMESVEFNLDELDLGKADEGEATLTLGDEVDTKLDLARAYADMGDNEAAHNLLLEVLQTGNDKQKQEAETLNQRLKA